ncbi:MAG: right-handed parallel beta-helix repeat-containing protein [Thermoplasmata archaeon]|nr:right-handed parallel beta-helix repeat-containing protein [Thermoplasmata archaeon]
MKRIAISLFIVLSLLTGSTLMIMDITLAGDPAPPTDGSLDVIQYIDGDWNVTAYENYSNEIIMLSGNLSIKSTGTLELINVTLMMNSTYGGQYSIEVWNGANFYLNDSDNNQLTIDDATVITNGASASLGYNFTVNKTATFSANNSVINNCGLLGGQPNSETSGLTILSDNVSINNSKIFNCSNGLVIDSVNLTLENCSVYDNQYNGIYFTNTSIPSHYFDISISNTKIVNNTRSGIFYNGSSANITLQGNAISNNDAGGALIIGGMNINMSVKDNIINSNTGEGGIGIWGIPSLSVIRVDISNNNISNNAGLSPVRVGFKFDEVPANRTYANITDNEIWAKNFSSDGAILMLSTEYIKANISDNNIYMPSVSNGIHIGKASKEINIWPAVKTLELNLHNNNITNAGAGAVRVCAIGDLYMNMTGNHVFHPNSQMTCGAVSIGWFKAGTDGTTPLNTTAIVNNNIIEGISDSGAIGIKAIDNINATIENNTIEDVHGGSIRIGWLDDIDANNLAYPWAYPTKNVSAKISNNFIAGGKGPGIWLYSSNGSKIFDNNISSKAGPFGDERLPGDGIRIQSSYGGTMVFNNTISDCLSTGFRAYNSNKISVFSNIIVNNQYGIGLDKGSNHNILYNNNMTKEDTRYGYYIGTNSLNNTLPENNTVNGEFLRYYHNLFGTEAAHQSVENLVVDEPLMANLGQIIIANSTFVDIQNNTADNGYSGITMIGIDNSSVSNNHANNNVYGIRLQDLSNTNALHENSINTNTIGIALLSSSIFNIMWNNNISKEYYQTGLHFDPEFTTLNNQIYLNNTVEGETIRYYHNESQLLLDNLTLKIPKIMNIGQMVLIECNSSIVQNVSIANGARGLFIYNSDNISLFDSNISFNTLNCNFIDSSNLTVNTVTTTNGSYNYVLNDVTNATIEDCIITNGSSNIGLRASSPTIINSTIGKATIHSFSLSKNSHPVLINCSFNETSTDITLDSTITVEWYLHVTALTNGIGIENAIVNVTNSIGAIEYNFITGANGIIRNMKLTGSIIGHNNTTYCSPYNLSVSKGGYEDYNAILLMNDTKDIQAVLFDKTKPVIVLGPTIEPATIYISSSFIWLNATIDDSLGGNSIITCAEWVISTTHPSLLNITSNYMDAQDGAFDEASEIVTYEFNTSDWTKGQYTFWIRGMDSSGNWCDWESIDILIIDNEGPAIKSALSISPTIIGTSTDIITLSATLDDTGLGDSRIIEAECSIEGSESSAIINATPTTIMVADGAYDQSIEHISITFDISLWVKGQYTISIRGRDEFNNWGDWESVSFDVVDDVAPSTPSNLMAVASGEEGTVTLTWSPNNELDLAGYKIYRSLISGSSYQLVAILGPQDTTWQDQELQDDVSYFYAITAFDNATIPNESDYSEEATGIPNTASFNFASIWWLLIVIPLIFFVIVLQYINNRKKDSKDQPSSPEEEIEFPDGPSDTDVDSVGDDL